MHLLKLLSVAPTANVAADSVTEGSVRNPKTYMVRHAPPRRILPKGYETPNSTFAAPTFALNPVADRVSQIPNVWQSWALRIACLLLADQGCAVDVKSQLCFCFFPTACAWLAG
jgi:hypothetical protein